MQYGLSKTKIVFTIHNLEFGAANIGKAMGYSDKCTTVTTPTIELTIQFNHLDLLGNQLLVVINQREQI